MSFYPQTNSKRNYFHTFSSGSIFILVFYYGGGSTVGDGVVDLCTTHRRKGLLLHGRTLNPVENPRTFLCVNCSLLLNDRCSVRL